MNKLVLKLSLGVFVLAISSSVYGQEMDEDVKNWYNGKGAGMHTDKAYKKLKKRKTQTVVVAVIDNGIDIEHEDLQGRIWTNTDEIAGNGIDDDNNGYVDDVHGWNYLGNKNGENGSAMRLERTRILAKLMAKSETETLSAEESALMEKVKAEVDAERSKYEGYIGQMDMLKPMIENVPAMVSSKLGTDSYTVADIEKWIKDHPEDKDMMGLALSVTSGELTVDVIDAQKKQIQGMLDTHHNVDFNGRAVVGDDPDDFSDLDYGNPDVEGPDAGHGTHVGGSICAVRGNGIGVDGVATDVLLMSLLVVPDGDEFDKDIARAIRYAVDNGAKIINMSFGKSYSPHAEEVYAAFEYADSKGVLCVHAAGNDSKDISKEPNFPTSNYEFQTKKLDHYITIGASTRFPKEKLAATFSNYAQEEVDVFAPGHDIWSTVPQSDYAKYNGTSMACPMVAGVAALLKSNFPSLSMKEIKEIILSSAKSYKGKQQFKPGTKELVDFGTLSVTGGVVNVKSAVKACIKLEKAKAKSK